MLSKAKQSKATSGIGSRLDSASESSVHHLSSFRHFARHAQKSPSHVAAPYYLNAPYFDVTECCDDSGESDKWKNVYLTV
jgi:hypothetical protein